MNNPRNNQKTLRHFQCRDYLWEIFEQMSNDLDCSTDYLINEAMRQYAKTHNYGRGAAATGQGPATGAATAAFERPGSPTDPAPLLGRPPTGGHAIGRPPSGRISLDPAYAPAATNRPIYPSVSSPSSEYLLGNPRRNTSPTSPPDHAAQSNRPGGPSHPPDSPVMLGAPNLHVIFNGQRFPVRKSEFVIGRGARSADLAIRDGNISRRHAAVVFENGAFYMRDLGSTNGVDFQGRRITNKRIEEGDIFQICDYEMRFTYT